MWKIKELKWPFIFYHKMTALILLGGVWNVKSSRIFWIIFKFYSAELNVMSNIYNTLPSTSQENSEISLFYFHNKKINFGKIHS